MTNRPGD